MFGYSLPRCVELPWPEYVVISPPSISARRGRRGPGCRSRPRAAVSGTNRRRRRRTRRASARPRGRAASAGGTGPRTTGCFLRSSSSSRSSAPAARPQRARRRGAPRRRGAAALAGDEQRRGVPGKSRQYPAASRAAVRLRGCRRGRAPAARPAWPRRSTSAATAARSRDAPSRSGRRRDRRRDLRGDVSRSVRARTHVQAGTGS